MAKAFTGGLRLSCLHGKEELRIEHILPSDIDIPIPEGYTVTVHEGTAVTVGQTVASREGKPDVVCGLSGTVSGVKRRSVQIHGDGIQSLSKKCVPAKGNIRNYTADDLHRGLLAMGIACPAKTQTPPSYLIVDCCEPVPDSLSIGTILASDTAAVVGGIKIMMIMAGARRAVCAVPARMKDAADAIREKVGDSKLIGIRFVSNKYPQSHPLTLVSSLFDIELSPEADTADAGYPVVRADHCAAAYRALVEGIPYTERLVTVSGDCVHRNYLIEAPVGTDIEEMIGAFPSYARDPGYGLLQPAPFRIPFDEGAVVTHRTYAVVVAYDEPDISESSCIECGRCADVCPVKLVPSFLIEAVSADNPVLAQKCGIGNCIGCGCCDRVCPGGIRISRVIASYRKTERGGFVSAYEEI